MLRRPMIAGFTAVVAGLGSQAAAQVFVAGYIGAAATRPADINLTLGSDRMVFESVPFSGRSFDSPLYYGYRAGIYLTRHFGVDAEFVHLKVYADLDRPVEVRGTLQGASVAGQAPLGRYAQQFEISHGLNMVLVNGIFRLPVLSRPDPSEAPLTVVLRAGAGPTIPRPEIILLRVGGGGYQLGRAAVQGAAGIEARVARHLFLLAEYKYTFTPAKIDVPGGQATLCVRSQHVVTGLLIRF